MASGADLDADQLAVLEKAADGALFSHLVWLPSASEPQPEAAAAIALELLERGWLEISEVDLEETGHGARTLAAGEAELAIQNGANWVIADAEGVAPFEARSTAAGLKALAHAK